MLTATAPIDLAGRSDDPTPRSGAAPRAAGCSMPATGPAVAGLRSFARRVVSDWSLPTADHDALALVVSELVGNVVRHSGSADVTVLITATDTALTVEVRDNGQWRHPGGRPGEDGLACDGRGLQLVEAFATRCTVLPTPDGTRVAAELPLAG